MSSLTALLSRDSADDLQQLVEAFVADALADAGVWSSRRASDGIQTLRIVEWVPKRLRVCGKIWSIDQTLHTFWLDADGCATPTSTTWTLYFDVDETSMTARRAHNILYVLQDPGEVVWRVTLIGPT